MYDESKLVLYKAGTQHIDALLEGITSLPMRHSVFLDGVPERNAVERIINDPANYVFLTYHEGELMGYSLCNFRTSATADFHWGVCRKHKYITKMIKQSFNVIKEMPVNFLGFVPEDNVLSKKITEKIGFEYVGVIKNYYKGGLNALMYQYSNKEV